MERRVLTIPAEGSYTTVEPELTAESYTAGSRQRYALMMGAAAVYIVGYGIVFCRAAEAVQRVMSNHR